MCKLIFLEFYYKTAVVKSYVNNFPLRSVFERNIVYDGIYQLVKEDRRESDNDLVYINYFEYNLAGNRTHLHYVDSGTDDWTYYTYNIENQLTIEEKGGTATYYTYNPVGELIGKKVGEDEYSYEYTYEGLMKEFTNGETNAYYTYDAYLQRIQKEVDGAKTKYLHDQKHFPNMWKPMNSEWISDIVAEYDGDDTLLATYNTPMADKNLTVKIGENIYHYVQDGLGSVRNLLDSNEVAQNTYDYEAFGSAYGTPTENVSNSFRFTGRQWDAESLLHFYRMRMYNQATGRFLTKDPVAYDMILRFNGPSSQIPFNGTSALVNWYLYTSNNPVIYTDPTGLSEETKGKCKCGPEVTDWLIKRMMDDKDYPTIKERRESLWWKSWMPLINLITEGEFFRQFYDLYKDYGQWDFKNVKQFTTPNCPSDDCKHTVTLCNICFYQDLPGNIHYGWIGNYAGLIFGVLVAAPSFGKIITGEYDQRDTLAMAIGYNMARRFYGKQLYAQPIKNLLCAQLDVYKNILLLTDKEKVCKPCNERYPYVVSSGHAH